MPSPDNFLLFVAASVLLVLTPGPNLLYLVSRTLCQGRAAGIVSLAGRTAMTAPRLAQSSGASAPDATPSAAAAIAGKDLRCA